MREREGKVTSGFGNEIWAKSARQSLKCLGYDRLGHTRASGAGAVELNFFFSSTTILAGPSSLSLAIPCLSLSLSPFLFVAFKFHLHALISR